MYDENSKCPVCGGNLEFAMFKKGPRFRCPEGHYKVYPDPENISKNVFERYFKEHLKPQQEAVLSHQHKYKSSR